MPASDYDGRIKNITVAVLAGGSSRRMGVDKAMVCFDGVSLLEHVCLVASQTGLPVLVIGRDLLIVPGLAGHVKAMPDDIPGSGPLGGLTTALKQCPTGSWVLLCPTDLPLLKGANLAWLVDILGCSPENTLAIVPVWQGQPQPLFALYNSKILAQAEAALKTGRRAMHQLLEEIAEEVYYVPLPLDHVDAITDCDTPEQLSQIRALIKQSHLVC